MGYSTAFLRVWVRLSATKATKNNRNAVTRERTEMKAVRNCRLSVTKNISLLLTCGVFIEKIKGESLGEMAERQRVRPPTNAKGY